MSRFHWAQTSGDRMIHKGVEYTVTPTADPEFWLCQFELGGKVITSKLKTRLGALAERRSRWRIDRALKRLTEINMTSDRQAKHQSSGI